MQFTIPALLGAVTAFSEVVVAYPGSTYCAFYNDKDCTQQNGPDYDYRNGDCFENTASYMYCSVNGGAYVSNLYHNTGTCSEDSCVDACIQTGTGSDGFGTPGTYRGVCVDLAALANTNVNVGSWHFETGGPPGNACRANTC